MKKTIAVALILAFLCGSALAAVPNCNVNTANETGIIDCGVQKLDPTTGSVIAEYSSLDAYYNSGYPAALNDGDEILYRVYLKNYLEVAVTGIHFSCGIFQRNNTDFGPCMLIVRTYGYELESSDGTGNSLFLNPSEEGWLEYYFKAEDIIEAADAKIWESRCSVYNESMTSITNGVRTISLNTTGPEVKIADWDFPAAGSTCTLTAGGCDVDQTLTLGYSLENTGSTDLEGFSIFRSQDSHGDPLNNAYTTEDGQCVVTGLSGETLTAGGTMDVICTDEINFLRGNSIFSANARAYPNGKDNLVKIRCSYVVKGPAYTFLRLSPYSLYQSTSGHLSAEYRIEKDLDPSPPTEIYFVAQVKKEGEEWVKAGEWQYDWANSNAVRRDLTDYSPQDALSAGKKQMRIMAFDGSPPNPLPDPATTSGTFSANLLDWSEASFSVPRMVQPEEEPFFPGEETWGEAGTPFTIGLRNLSDVSSCGQTITYELDVTQGDPAELEIQNVTCDDVPAGFTCPSAPYSWPLTFTFEDVLNEEDFPGAYGGLAPALNAELQLEASDQGLFELELAGQTDAGCTALDESTLAEMLEISVEGDKPSIKSISAPDTIVGTPIDIVVEVSNYIELSKEPNVVVYDAVTDEKISEPSLSAENNGIYSYSFTPTEEQNFRVKATIKSPCIVCEKSTWFQAIEIKPVPAPEIGLVAVALAALGVLAVIGLSRKK